MSRPRVIDWTQPDVAANVWLLEKKNLEERGVRARLIDVISNEVRDWPIPPGEKAIGEHANTLIKLHKNLRLSKKSETS